MEFRNDKNMHWMLGGGADGDRETFATWNACILPTLSILKPIVWLFWREWSTENSKERLKYIYIYQKKKIRSLCPLSSTEISSYSLTLSTCIHFVLLFCVIEVITSALNTPCISIFSISSSFFHTSVTGGFCGRV